MSAIALPSLFQKLDSRMGVTVQRMRAHRTRRPRLVNNLVALLLAPGLYRIARDLGQIIVILKSGETERMPRQDLRELAAKTLRIYERVSKLLSVCEEAHLAERAMCGRILEGIGEKNEYLDSILEGMYLSLNQDFRDLVSDAIQELRDVKAHTVRSSFVDTVSN